MRHTLAIAVFSVLLLWAVAEVRPTTAQACEVFAGFPGECSSFVDYPVFVPPGLNQSMLAGNIVQSVAAIRMFPSGCRLPTLRLLCATAFR
jgi:hypothetical protein